MKYRTLAILIMTLLVLGMFGGCAQETALQAQVSEQEARIYVIPDAAVAEDEYEPKIYEIDPNAPQVEIPDESVPMASSFVDISDGISEREAEAIAINHAGLGQNDVSFLHSRLVEDGEPDYYHVEFRNEGVPYKFWISIVDGEILLYEKGL